MAILAIVRRDLLRMVRNPGRTALLFAMPVVLAGIFALVFGGGGASEGITIRVLLFDEDDSLLSALARGAGGQGGGGGRLELVEVGEEGYEMMEDGDASALVHIPSGFTDAYLDGRPATLQVVKNPAQRFLPQVVEEGVGVGAVVLSEARRVFASEIDAIQRMRRTDSFPTDASVAALSTAINDRMRSMERTLFPPVIGLESVTVDREETASASTVDVLSVFLPGLTLMGVLFLAQAATTDLLRDRESGLLRHLVTAPLPISAILLGKCLSVLLVTALGFGVLVAVGALFGVSWGPPIAVAALLAASSVAASGTMLLLMSLARTSRQAETLSTIVILVWSMLGGAFVPLSQMPDLLRPLARSSLVFWGTDGFMTLILDGGGLADIRLNLAVLVVAGALFLLAGAARLRRTMAAGRL